MDYVNQIIAMKFDIDEILSAIAEQSDDHFCVDPENASYEQVITIRVWLRNLQKLAAKTPGKNGWK